MDLIKTNGSVNVIDFVGVCTKYDQGPLKVIFEYAECGSFKEFLFHHSNQKMPNDGGFPISISPSPTLKVRMKSKENLSFLLII